jgi:L-ribulokinase
VRRTLALGLDFGTESLRALLLDVELGRELGSFVAAYRHGVLTTALPNRRALPADWALQDPEDWLTALDESVHGVVARTGADPLEIGGIGVDFTSCTILPTTLDGTPLCRLTSWADDPHAWPKLWKHHAAQRQADDLMELAAGRGEKWLARYGGRVSSEWLLPKVMQTLDEAPAVFAAADRVVEGGDWVVWQLTGRLLRNACAAGFKALWHKREGYPSPSLLEALRPGLGTFFAGPGTGDIAPPGAEAGPLCEEWTHRLGLAHDVRVGVAIVDAHAGLLGGGVPGPGPLYLATGTSTCHVLLAPEEHTVHGISSVVEDGIVAGLFAYEAGQASVGDTFDWYSRLVGRSHRDLTGAAGRLRPGESGLLALDWWNGCRTPLVDADLSGVVLGVTLATPPEAIYRALLEATAYGTRLVVDTFAAGGLAPHRLIVGGGLSRNDLLLQIYADVTGLSVEVAASEQPSARGAAVLGAAAAGLFPSVAAAAAATAEPPVRVLKPRHEFAAGYDELYALYRELVLAYGASDSPLKRLSALRHAASVEPRVAAHA